MNDGVSGTIPESIGNLRSLTHLFELSSSLEIIEFVGGMNDEIEVDSLINKIELLSLPRRLAQNPGLIGPIPESIGNLSSIENLYEPHSAAGMVEFAM